MPFGCQVLESYWRIESDDVEDDDVDGYPPKRNTLVLSFIVMILTKQEHLVVDGSCPESKSSGGEFGSRPPRREVHHQLGGVECFRRRPLHTAGDEDDL